MNTTLDTLRDPFAGEHPRNKGAAPADIVTATEELLASRPSREPDRAIEAEALLRLADEMADNPGNVLNVLCDLIMKVCNAESAGVSLLNGSGDMADFVWPAIAGAWGPYMGGGMPRDASPCGVVLQTNAVLIYHNVEQQFPAAAAASPRISEILLAPFHKGGKPVGTVWAILHQEGRQFDREDRRRLINLARFAAAAYQNIKTDEKARHAQERLGLTIANAKVISLWDWLIPDDKVIADERFAGLFGVDPYLARRGAPISVFIDGIHPGDRERVSAEIDEAVKNRTSFSSEYRVVGADGAIHVVLAKGQCEYDPSGLPLRFPGVIIDMSDQRRVESALSESEGRYRALFNSIDAGFCVIKLMFDDSGQAVDYRFLETNSAFDTQTGLIDVIGRTIRELLPTIEPHWLETYGEVARTGLAVRFENQALGLGGRWFDVHAYRIGDPTDGHVAILFTDISERRGMEAALRTSERQFRSLAQAMPNHVWTAQPTGQLDWFNDRVYAYSGAAEGELDGEAWASIVHPEDRSTAGGHWAEALTAGEPYETEFRIRQVDGHYRWHIVRAVPIREESGEILRWVGTNTDIEDQKAAANIQSQLNVILETRVEESTADLATAQEALRQSQKMEAVGQLTGGIAHDFNNMLTGITGSLDLMRRRMDAGRTDGLTRYIDTAMGAALRAAGLTHRLLAFARQQTLDTKPQNVDVLVSGMMDMLQRALGESVQLECRVAEDLWLALTDTNQLENALLNLAINARDAMSDGGQLTIEAENAELDEVYARTNGDVVPGEYVMVSVSDTGCGMPADVVAKAFDPFYTTKPIGEGTGLGLSMIYGFIKQSGGHIRIYSEPGRGTSVKLYLRRALRAEELETVKSSGEMPRGDGERVLVVEDDPTVRLLITEVLQELGYLYFEAEDARAAVPFIESNQVIDLMISDVGLPVLDGRQLAEIARRHRPDLKILFVTGYAKNALSRSSFLGAGMEMMTKPFSIDALAERVRALIEAGN